MKRLFNLIMFLFCGMLTFASCQSNSVRGQEETKAQINSKSLVAYFSATGNTKDVALQIARLTGADIHFIEPARPYAEDPYDDSEQIKKEAYQNLRPALKNTLSKESMAQYDTLYVGSPIWWHQPAMVVCTFLDSYDLSGKVVIPFFTYGADTYLNESMQKIYRLTPKSNHIPERLPEDLNAGDITTPGPSDDREIEMPGNANGVEKWLGKLGIL